MKNTIRLLNLLTITICVISIIIIFISIMSLDNLPGQEIMAKKRVIVALVLLAPIMVCHYANTKLDVVKNRKQLITPAIITLLFGNVISGILMLRISDFQ